VKYKKVFIPNSFSPNGDQLNDRLTIFGSQELKLIEQFVVFDRWGEIVYRVEQVDPGQSDLGWDGSFNGELMNPGVYIARLAVRFSDDSLEEFVTDVTLLR
jgi:gliding motility-associated-like protein